MAHGSARIGRDKYRTEIEVGGHRLVSDEGAKLGGADAGPAPYDLVLAGLGACTAITLRMYADRKQWPLESVEVQLKTVREGDTLRIERTLVITGLVDEQKARMADMRAAFRNGASVRATSTASSTPSNVAAVAEP